MTTKRLSIAGSLPMSQAEAQDLIDSGHRVVVHLWGEGPYTATIYATAAGLEYRKDVLALGSAADAALEVEAYLIES
jgi:hypothetical protein